MDKMANMVIVSPLELRAIRGTLGPQIKIKINQLTGVHRMLGTHKHEVILIGCGAMALEVAAYIGDIDGNLGSVGGGVTVLGVWSTDFSRKTHIEDILGYKINQYDDFDMIEDAQSKEYVICIGSNVAVHSYLSDVIRPNNLDLFSVIHPTAYVAKMAKICDGVILAPRTFVGPCAKIGSGTIVNVGSTIGHDCTIGEACVISPHVNINGSVNVGAGTFFGSKTSVDPGVEIGKFSKMISGSSVRADLKEGHLFVSDQKKSIKMFNPENGKSLFSGQ